MSDDPTVSWFAEGNDPQVTVTVSAGVNRDGLSHVAVAAGFRSVDLLVRLPLTEDQIGSLVPALMSLSLSVNDIRRAVQVLMRHGASRSGGGVVALPDPVEPAIETGVRPLSRPVARLLSDATEGMSPDMRARYAAEFDADARWIEGRWARLWFALCLRLWTAPRLRRAAAAAAAHGDLPRRA